MARYQCCTPSVRGGALPALSYLANFYKVDSLFSICALSSHSGRITIDAIQICWGILTTGHLVNRWVSGAPVLLTVDLLHNQFPGQGWPTPSTDQWKRRPPWASQRDTNPRGSEPEPLRTLGRQLWGCDAQIELEMFKVLKRYNKVGRCSYPTWW